MKKILQYSLVVLFLIVIVFFSLGVFIPSFRYESRISVNKPAENSFRVFTNVFLLYEWVPGLEKVEWVSGLPTQVGSKWKMSIVREGKEYAMMETLTACKENESFAFTMHTDILTNLAEVRFMPKGESCEIISSNQITGKNIFWKSLLVFVQSDFRERDQAAYNKLKEVIEKNN